jgi:hypothetical protein
VKPHRFHPEADEEYASAPTHYANISPELGGRFYDEIEGLIAGLHGTAPLPPNRRRREATFIG